jgi:hypothetical protein
MKRLLQVCKSKSLPENTYLASSDVIFYFLINISLIFFISTVKLLNQFGVLCLHRSCSYCIFAFFVFFVFVFWKPSYVLDNNIGPSVFFRGQTYIHLYFDTTNKNIITLASCRYRQY